jgi:hypothetical protein
MLNFQVSFMKTVPDSTGHDHVVCQFRTQVAADNEQAAIGLAIDEFCRNRDIACWGDYADALELRALPSDRPPAPSHFKRHEHGPA